MPLDMISIGCLTDGRTVYIEPAGAVDLHWLRRKHPGVRIILNAELNRDEIEYSAEAYREFLGYLRLDGWEMFSAGSSDTEETLRFTRR